MTAKGYASMYSGRANPERELTPTEISAVKEIMSSLSEPWTGATHPQLGFTGYGVWSPDENWYVSADFRGFATVWDVKKLGLDYYKDTVGLTAYLASILKEMLDKHYEDDKKAMDDYIASLVPFVTPPWEPNL